MRKYTTLLIIFVLVLTALIHGYNLFHFPYYEDDEGTYMSQAWSLATQGKIAPYTYTYDHAPGGWILIAAWSAMTGFSTFGSAINSGRVLMLIINLFTVLFLFLTTKKLTNNNWLAALVSIFYSFSPLGIYYQRRVLLDNIMTFWVMLSVCLAVYSSKTFSVVLGGLVFGLAVITKETAVVFLLPFLYLLYSRERKIHHPLIWLGLAFVPISLYFFYAYSRGELFPPGMFGSFAPHVSLIGTFLDQLRRPGGNLLDGASLVRQSVADWFSMDPLVVLAGAVAISLSVFLKYQNAFLRPLVFFAVFFSFYLLKGGLVFDFYILPLLPFMSLSLGIVLGHFLEKYQVSVATYVFLFAAVSVLATGNLLLFGNRPRGYSLFSSDQTTPQNQATKFILSQNLPDVFYAIDNYAYVDLQANKDNHFKYAEYYWKVDRDPAISLNVLNSNWRYISYLAVTPQMKGDIERNPSLLPLLFVAKQHSSPLISFTKDGWGVDILQVNQSAP